MKKHESLHEGLAAIRSRMAAVAHDAGREPEEIALIAVSKTFGADDIQPVIDGGQRAFGENRVQEAQGKWPGLRETTPDIELHLIGPLQSNKAKDAVALFDVIHTIDRPKIARVIAQEMAAQKRTPTLFIQVNTGDEPQKAGVSLADVAAFHAQCRDEFQLPIDGLMCIPPVDEDAEPHFRRLAETAGELGLSGLSMGMSADFETAIRCGATHIRVGSAIFGARPTPQSAS
ncbi:MAG: YggS family pyridoxal phosphate-dependent enzyme [Rhodomicrobiaceae bacterium]